MDAKSSSQASYLIALVAKVRRVFSSFVNFSSPMESSSSRS